MRKNGIQACSLTLYRRQGWLGRFDGSGYNKVHDLEFTALEQVWVGDVTNLKVNDDWRYLAVVMDLYSRRIPGWSYSKEKTALLTARALRNALGTRAPTQYTIFHGHRGVEYLAARYRDLDFPRSNRHLPAMIRTSHYRHVPGASTRNIRRQDVLEHPNRV